MDRHPTGYKVLTLDLETTGLDWQRDQITLIGYRINGQGTVIQIVPGGGDDEIFRDALADPKVTKRGHNIKFDLLFLMQNGYTFAGLIDDTAILAYLDNPFESIRLKDLVEQRLKNSVTRLEDFAIRPKKKELALYAANPAYFQIDKDFYEKEKFMEYNRADVTNCDKLRADLITTDWYRQVEQPLVSFLMEIEQKGIQLDTEHLKRLETEYEERIKKVEEELQGVNAKSPKQVRQYLQASGVQLLEKTEKGEPKTDKLVLKRLTWAGNTNTATLLKHRELSKLLNTYVKPLLGSSDGQGRIHGSFNQVGASGSSSGTKTGRLTSSKPNLQNIPDRTEEGRKIRRAFIASRGYLLFDSDLKQIEPRLVAHYTQNKILLEAYAKGQDTHAIMGGVIFGKPPELLSKLERFIGKTSWLASFYGCSAKKLKVIAETISEDPIPYDVGYFETIARNLEKGNPQLYEWRRQHIEGTRKLGYISTLGGRKINIPGLSSKNPWDRMEAERQAINYQIQGSAADVMKLILVRFKKEFVDQGYGHVLATIHDEILGEIPELGKLVQDDVLDLINDLMTTTVKLYNVSIEADSKFIQSWDEK